MLKPHRVQWICAQRQVSWVDVKCESMNIHSMLYFVALYSVILNPKEDM